MLHRHDRRLLDAPPQNWRPILRDYASDWILRPSGLAGGCSDGETLIRFVESARRCWSLVGVGGKGGGGAAAASPAAVVALPSVAADGGGECAICREEMGAGREVCELPCGHLFHWICVLRWLGRRDTCPCCRRRLPSDDVRREIERLMDDIAGVGGGGGGGGL
ncbi:RING/U-box superfamily protein [Striga asiatica]|uniref:RING/U-box superfamily protein n=1 Tax=Striga asiatica TaxID=4170 RepID=A0A5A7QEX3_STRAF|nr:RING/U-box superfamily protein [Striga asiatica]